MLMIMHGGIRLTNIRNSGLNREIGIMTEITVGVMSMHINDTKHWYLDRSITDK